MGKSLKRLSHINTQFCIIFYKWIWYATEGAENGLAGENREEKTTQGRVAFGVKTLDDIEDSESATNFKTAA